MAEETRRPAAQDVFGEGDPYDQVRAQGLMLMLKGAGYAAVAFAAVMFFVGILALVGRSLPPASKEAPDPTPASSSLVVEGTRTA